MFYALSDSNPDLQLKLKSSINLFIALAPVTRFDHFGSIIGGFLIPYTEYLATFFDLIGIYEFGNPLKVIASVVCVIDGPLCQYSEGFLTTSDPSFDDPDRF